MDNIWNQHLLQFLDPTLAQCKLIRLVYCDNNKLQQTLNVDSPAFLVQQRGEDEKLSFSILNIELSKPNKQWFIYG